MASIGIILRADQELEELPADWVPKKLGSRVDVLRAIESCITADDASLAIVLRVEGTEDSEDPRTISVTGVWGQREAAILKRLCNVLGDRFYDAEAGDFIEL